MDFSSIWTVFLFFFSILACRPITVLVHELGHAIPSLLFTKQPVTIYVGSYGDRSTSWFFRLGRLQGFFSYDIFQQQMGLCYHSQARTIRQTLLIILGGPIASLLFGLFLIIIVSNFKFPQLIEFTLYLMLVSSIFDFFTNMIPTKNPSYLFDGSPVYNDGNSFFKLLKQARYPESYFKALEFHEQKKYKRAIHKLHLVLEDGFQDKEVYNKLIQVYFEDKQYERALNTYNSLLTKHKLSSEEYHILAKVYWELENYEKVILACNKILNQNIKSDSSHINPQTILLRGQAYLKLKQFEYAINDFDQAIGVNSAFSYLGFSFKGLAYLRQNQFVQAKENLDIAFELAPDDPYVIFHKGIYFYKIQEFNTAMKLFQEARSIDENIVEVGHYIASTLPYLK